MARPRKIWLRFGPDGGRHILQATVPRTHRRRSGAPRRRVSDNDAALRRLPQVHREPELRLRLEFLEDERSGAVRELKLGEIAPAMVARSGEDLARSHSVCARSSGDVPCRGGGPPTPATTTATAHACFGLAHQYRVPLVPWNPFLSTISSPPEISRGHVRSFGFDVDARSPAAHADRPATMMGAGS